MDKSVNKPAANEALDMLKQGNSRFAAAESEHNHTDKARLMLAGSEDQGDHAFATVISCSDSRVPVELIFDAGVMDIFVIRVAGYVCNLDEIASIEYGLAHVHTPLLVVLGHTQCGAVTAVTRSVQGRAEPLSGNIEPLANAIVPAVKRAIRNHGELQGDDLIPRAIEENVWQSMGDLLKQSAITRELLAEGRIKVVGAIYDVASGKVDWLPESKVEHL